MSVLGKMVVIALGVSLITACGGGKPSKGSTRATAAKPPPDDEPESEAEPEPKKKKAPKVVHAKAALTPVKGTKLKPALVTLSQREGEDTNVEAEAFDGAKPGTYWLVVHDGTECGPNATKAGPPWPGGTDANLKIVIGKDMTGGLDEQEVKLALEGDAGAVGHALVLHEDKKGKAGKALACGLIEEVDAP